MASGACPMSPFDGLASPAWMLDAACVEVGVEPFIPEYQGAKPNAAKAICAVCPVIDACRAYALADASLVGVWAGTTMRERRDMRGEAAA